MERESALGRQLRDLREKRQLPLREVAAAAHIDSTLLSKIELGQRLPTAEQASVLAEFFGIAPAEVEASRIAEKFWRRYSDNPAAQLAATRIQETAPSYGSK